MFIATPPSDTPIVVTGYALEPARQDSSAIALELDDPLKIPEHRIERLLTAIPDVQTFRRADSDTAHPTSSGLTARGLGGNGASRVIVVADGVPQNDPFGGWVNWPALSMDRIDAGRMERGGGQPSWGSGAIAGVLELDSAKPTKGTDFAVQLSHGSRASVETFGHLQAGRPQAYLRVSAGYRESDGFIPIARDFRGSADITAPYRQWNVAMRGGTLVGETDELQFGIARFDDLRERGLQFTQNRSRGTDLSMRFLHSGPNPLEISVFRQQRSYSSEFAAVDSGRTASHLTLDQYQVPASGWGARVAWTVVSGDKLTFKVGADRRAGMGSTNENYFFVAGKPTRHRVAGGKFSVAGAYWDLNGQGARLSWSLGGRLDRWALYDGELAERQLTGMPITNEHYPDRSGWRVSGRGNLAMEIKDGIGIKVTAYQGWRLPSLNELYRPYRVGSDAYAANPKLRNEAIHGVDASIEFQGRSDWAGTITFFGAALRNAIANAELGQGPGTYPGVGFVAPGGRYFQRRNVSALVSKGVEISSRKRWKSWQAQASLSYVMAEIKAKGDAAALNRKRPAQVPELSMAAQVEWTPAKRYSIVVGARYVGNAFDDDENRSRLKPALTMRAAAQVKVNDRLSLSASVDNIFNTRVESALYADGAIERATPRAAWVGMAFKN